GNASTATNSTMNPAAWSVGRFGSYTPAVTFTCGACCVCCVCLFSGVLLAHRSRVLQEHCETCRASLSERQLHPRCQTDSERSPAAHERREKADEGEVPHAEASRGDKGDQSHDISEGEHTHRGRDRHAGRGNQASNQHPERNSERRPADEHQTARGDDGGQR